MISLNYLRPLIFFCSLLSFPVFGSNSFVWLRKLNYSNPELKKLRYEIARNLQSIAREKKLEYHLRFVRYRVRRGDNFFKIMAKTSQTGDTLASLNHIINPNALKPGSILLIPNARGIFSSDKRRNIVRRYNIPVKFAVKSRNGWFIPGHRFSVQRKKLFLGHGFYPPLRSGRITSRFGVRRDPFSRRSVFHGGIDIGALAGTEVLASRRGRVSFAGRKPGYGNLIILDHGHGYETYYGHLASMRVKKGERVETGSRIGFVGSTGRTTGPHLHFEMRMKGKRRRPRFIYGPS